MKNNVLAHVWDNWPVFMPDIRIRAEKNLQYYERILNSKGTRKMIDPRVCSHLCCCTNTKKVRQTRWMGKILFLFFSVCRTVWWTSECLLRWMPSSTTVIKKRNCRRMWRSSWKWCPTTLWGWPLSLYKLNPWLNSECQLMNGLLITGWSSHLTSISVDCGRKPTHAQEEQAAVFGRSIKSLKDVVSFLANVVSL